MTDYLLDTDVLVDALRGGSARLRARLGADDARLVVSTVTSFELAYGAERSASREHNHAAVEELLGFLDVEPFDRRSARHSGEIRAWLADRGRTIGAYDVMLAGQARSSGMVLATGNVAEFRRIPGLRVENWRN